MKIILLLIFTSLFTWANGSFYDLYAHNRANNKPNLITADFIASAYAQYKLSREAAIEEEVLKPRVLNFANYLYQGVLEMNLANKKQAVAYAGVFSLLAKGGNNLILPDGYEGLATSIGQEVQLIMRANDIAISPVMKVKIDYRAFRVPHKYQNNVTYYRTLKFAQHIPMPKIIRQTITASERLSNLERHIKNVFEQFIGVEQKSTTLFSAYRGLDYHIFKQTGRASVDEIAKALNPKTSTSPLIQQHLLNLYSAYDYDLKIMQTLLINGHKTAFKGYYTLSQYRHQLYRQAFVTKNKPTPDLRVKANIEPKLEETLSVMIEGALLFSNSLKKNALDKHMLNTLKELRRVAQKKSMNLKLNKFEIGFLNQLDKVFLEINGNVKDRPLQVKINTKLTQELLAPRRVGFGTKELGNQTWGGRFVHREL